MAKIKRVAVVGSEEKYWTPESKSSAIKRIRDILEGETPTIWLDPKDGPIQDYSSIVLVSGGCPKGGVDIWAEVVADSLGIKKEIYLPEINQWSDYNREYAGGEGWIQTEVHKKGYKSRNIEIATNCDVLYCIDPKDCDYSGGRWTMNYAKGLGKKAILILILEKI